MLGFAIIAAIALRILIPRWQKHPPNRAAATVVRPLGVHPTGPNGSWTRGDHFRAAGFSATVAIVCAAVAWLGGEIGQHTLNGSTVEMVATGLALLGSIGFIMAILMAAISLVKAAFARQPADAPRV